MITASPAGHSWFRIRIRLRRSLAAMSALTLVPLGLAAASPTATGEVKGDGRDLVVNGSFTHGTSGWRTNNKPAQRLTATDAESSGDQAVKLWSTSEQTVVLNDKRNTVTDAPEGAHYRVRASVRATNPNLAGQLRIREVNDGGVKTFGSYFWLTDREWHDVELRVTTTNSGSSLDLNVLAWDNQPGHALVVDDVSMQRIYPESNVRPGAKGSFRTSSDSTTAEAGTSGWGSAVDPRRSEKSPPAKDADTLSNGCSYGQRGLPECGAYMGAAVGGNSDPSSLESDVGRKLGLRRTYWNASKVDGAVETARDDLTHGRLPWISFKLGHSWAEMASGKGDRWARNLANRLGELDGPVWVAFHHEPEEDGNIRQWTAMQEHLAPIIRRNAPNVAYTIILTGWHQMKGEPKYHLDSLWPENTTIDVAGFDIYNWAGATKDGQRLDATDMRNDYFEPISQWAEANDVAWGLGETGYSDRAAQDSPHWVHNTYDDLVDTGGVAFAYFDSNLNSIAQWRLSSPSKQRDFANALRDSATLPRSSR